MKKVYNFVAKLLPISFMSNIKKVLISLTVSILSAVNLSAGETSLATSLMYELESAKTPGDSLAILYNLYDTAATDTRKQFALQILDITRRTNDYEAQLDMLRNLAVIGSASSDPDLIENAMDMMADIPDSEDKRQTMIFMRASRATADKFDADEERDNYTRQLLKTVADMHEKTSPYERVSRLFSLVTVLNEQTQGELLSQYLDMLDAALKTLPQLPNNYLRSQFNNLAAVAYFHNDEFTKSIRADRNQLLNVKRLQQMYAEKGRKYRNFDVTRYMRLRRMLQNEQEMTDSEVDSLIAQINHLVSTNKVIADMHDAHPGVRASILLHEQRYEEALPLLKQLSDSSKNIFERRYFTRRLIDTADKIGDIEAKHAAEIRNSHLLEEFLNYKNSERVRELQLLYDVNVLRRQQISERFSTERQHNCWLLIGLGVLLLISILLGALLIYEHRRNHSSLNNKTSLEDQNEALQRKLDRLTAKLTEARRRESEKTQLMTYISHELSTPLSAIINYSQMITEAVPEKEISDYVKNFISIIETNTRIIQTITADMQEFTLNDSKPIVANNVPTNPNNIATIAAETIEPRLDPRVKINVHPSSGTPMITTDPRRVQLLLLSCIDNMVNSIESGKITVRVVVSPATCQFIVSAPGATPGKEPARIPNYSSTLKSVNGEIAYNAEVPSMTLTLTL